LAFQVYLDADVHPIVADFVREARRHAEEGRDHLGIVVSDQLDVGDLVRRLTSGSTPLRS
jgi:hypothetical protein